MTATAVWTLGVDSGGTFTDLAAIDAATGRLRVHKVPSTPRRPAEAVRHVCEESGTLTDLHRLTHGTTVATNAVLERTGARLCLVTTAGFEDVVRIQRINRRYAFDLGWDKPEPLVARRDTIGVRERVGPDGEILDPLADAEVERVTAAVAALAERDAIEAVAISLLFSYVEPAHELALERALRAELPDLPVSRSSDVSPIWREYERTSTTLADAYVRPLMGSYLADLESELAGAAPDLLLLRSSGGTGRPASIAPQPVTMLRSGLAGGAVAGAHFARAAGIPHAITLDVGGTSTDIGLVEGGAAGHVDEFELEWGLPIVTPTVDVQAVGAGGGSIAAIDGGGLLQVGPASAGADPGPAAYGLGGTAATVTDALVALGRIDPSYFLGGRMTLDRAAATAALAPIAAELGADTAGAALAIVSVACENVANAIRILTVERGIDPRDHAIVAFGGAGPSLACGVAAALGIATVLVPPNPGIASAFGAAAAPLRVDRAWSLGQRSDELDEADVRRRFEAAEAEALAELRGDGLSGDPLVRRRISTRYHLQNYEERIDVPTLGDGFLAAVASAFHARHEAGYGYAFPDEAVELVDCSVALTGPEVLPSLDDPERSDPAVAAGERTVVAPNGAAVETAVVRRGLLGAERPGPLVVEEDDSTTYVPPGWHAVDAPLGAMLLRRDAEGS